MGKNHSSGGCVRVYASALLEMAGRKSDALAEVARQLAGEIDLESRMWPIPKRSSILFRGRKYGNIQQPFAFSLWPLAKAEQGEAGCPAGAGDGLVLKCFPGGTGNPDSFFQN